MEIGAVIVGQVPVRFSRALCLEEAAHELALQYAAFSKKRTSVAGHGKCDDKYYCINIHGRSGGASLFIASIFDVEPSRVYFCMFPDNKAAAFREYLQRRR